ncbi:MAG: hypothetical protein DRH08_10400 [Deltaproteobacteria bacterium]|nr:MAG: hypothetical protein DRH08_10400 [Deltaproteobacteria bacterium]
MLNEKAKISKAEAEREHGAALDATVGKVIKLVKLNLTSSADRRPDMDLEDTFTFGKYKDKRTLEYVMEHDMGYIDWLTNNEVVYFNEEAYEYLESLKGKEQ